MSQALHGDLMDLHAHAALVMIPRFIIPDDALLHVPIRRARARLLAVTLAPRPAELFRRSTEAKLAAADVQRAFGAGFLSVFAAFCVRIAVAPAGVVGRFTGLTAVLLAEAAVSGLAAAGSVLTGLVLATNVFIVLEKRAERCERYTPDVVIVNEVHLSEDAGQEEKREKKLTQYPSSHGQGVLD